MELSCLLTTMALTLIKVDCQLQSQDPVSEHQITNVQCSLYYFFKSPNEEILEKIVTTISQIDDSVPSYDITYIDSTTGTICASDTVQTSSCQNGICKAALPISNLRCLNNSGINITVSLSNDVVHDIGFPIKFTPVQIETKSNFIRVSFDKMTSTIRCTFIHLPKEKQKSCAVKYGPKSKNGCNDYDLPYQTIGYCSHSNSISLEADLDSLDMSAICFTVEAICDDKIVNVYGIYSTGSSLTHQLVAPAPVIWLIIGLLGIIIVATIIYIIGMVLFKKNHKTSDSTIPEYQQPFSESLGDHGIAIDIDNSGNEQDQLEPVDVSTTFYKLRDIALDSDEEDILMYEFARKHYPDYQPEDGFGYFQVSDTSALQLHKKVILMDKEKESIPKYGAFSSNIQHLIPRGWRDVYAQDRSYTRRLPSGSRFLYCVHSNFLTAFSKLYDVTKTCQQAVFTKEKNIAYHKQWIRYGYFEFTRPEYVKPHQRVIVMKDNGKLVSGPGIRHLIGATGDGSKSIKPPNLGQYSGWKHVFIQSDDDNRELQAGTRYLFCAIMERVTVHSVVYDVNKECTMEDFGRSHIPGFKLEHGYGYFEFTKEEYFKPHKRKMLMHKDSALYYTGAGAQFICTSGQYNEDVVSRRFKISPPNLEDTEWAHIFIQSQSRRRMLAPGTKFLYCEYTTQK